MAVEKREELEEDEAQFVHRELCVADAHLTEVRLAGATRALHALDVGEMDIDVIEVIIDVNTEIIMARSSGRCVGDDGRIHSVYPIGVFELAKNIVEMMERLHSDAAVLLDPEYIILRARPQRVGLAGSWRCPLRARGVRRASAVRTVYTRCTPSRSSGTPRTSS